VHEFLEPYENASMIPVNVQDVILGFVFDEYLYELIEDQLNEKEIVKHRFNYVEDTIIKVNYLKIYFRDNEQFIMDLIHYESLFFDRVYKILNNKYNLNLDEDKTKTIILPALYEFLVINLYDNIQNFISNFIMYNKKSILEYLVSISDKKASDLVTIRKKVNSDDGLIICRMNEIFSFPLLVTS
jgi:hypothetical protein